MKPLHSSTWRTESDCGVLVDVAEGRTTEWVPFREIVVTMDAGMTPAEARRLIADLQHAVALADDRPAVAEDQPKPRVWCKGDVIPADVTKVYGDDWIYERSGEDAWQSGLAIECGYTGHPMLARSTESLLAQYGSLSEVLADSEQVRHG